MKINPQPQDQDANGFNQPGTSAIDSLLEEIKAKHTPHFTDPKQQLYFYQYSWPRIIAYEKLIRKLFSGFAALSAEPPSSAIAGSKLKWTGSQVNLVELIYGLWYTGQVNNGNASVSELVDFFEFSFQLSLKEPHHTFSEIRNRKTASPAKFLEQMAAAIHQRVDDDLNYRPGK